MYFPKIKQTYEIQKDKIQLYCNQVFVTDEVKDIVPEFLMLLQGVIDSPDIPLNVSRSYLQGDPNVKKINSHITKKVADKLEEIFKNDRQSFVEKWESLGLFVKYGMMTDDKFAEKANKFLVMEEAASPNLSEGGEKSTYNETINIIAVPISTVNMTGFLNIIFGFSFTKDCTSASFTCLLSNNELDLLLFIFIIILM